MIEQITTDNNHVYSLYESQSQPYKKDNKTGKVLKISDIDSIISSFNKKQD